MEYVEKTVRVPKESDDVRNAVVEIFRDLRSGKSFGEVAAENWNNAVEAIKGYDLLVDEAKNDPASQARLVGLLVGDLLEILKEGK